MKTSKVDPSSTQTKYEIEQYLRSVNEGDQATVGVTADPEKVYVFDHSTGARIG